MFAIIDGTGAYNDQEYKMNMARSFCCQLDGIPDSKYYRGPGADGMDCDKIAQDVASDIRRSLMPVFVPVAQQTPVCLAGYSRGGAIAIQVAKYLRDNVEAVTTGSYPYTVPKPIAVKAMFLFDPVGYTPVIDFNKIPVNVKSCYVLFRDLSITKQDFFMPKWEVGDWKDFLIGCITTDEDRYAREWMGNCNTNPDSNKTDVRRAVISKASHGAAGGVPWVERPDDKAGTEGAANWMNTYLAAEGFKVVLKQKWFNRYSGRDYKPSKPIPKKDPNPLPPNWDHPSRNFKRPGEM